MCNICKDTFYEIQVNEKGESWAKQCRCVEAGKVARYMSAANIPEGFKEVDIENFNTHFDGCTDSQKMALYTAKRFVERSLVDGVKGIVFTGKCGTGKTHLAVGVLKKLIQEQGRRGLFYSSSHLLELIRSSFDREDLSEWEIMKPVLERDVLLLDDLGAGKLTEYVQEKIAYVLMERYNRKLTTIITTNFIIRPQRQDVENRTMPNDKTLGDCIGDRAFSRLIEMCVVVNMQGKDFRQSVKKAASPFLL